MTGREGSRVLAIESVDPLLSLLGAVGLAASRGTALIVDAAGDLGRGRRTLADIAADGPRLVEVSPGRAGIATISAGPLPSDEMETIAQELARRWPALVVRLDGRHWDGPTVPLRPLYPGCLAPTVGGSAAVWQRLRSGSRPPGPGPILPELRPALVRRVLGGGHPGSGRWVKAWRLVWDLPWA
jgi:hypothetical protein